MISPKLVITQLLLGLFVESHAGVVLHAYIPPPKPARPSAYSMMTEEQRQELARRDLEYLRITAKWEAEKKEAEKRATKTSTAR